MARVTTDAASLLQRLQNLRARAEKTKDPVVLHGLAEEARTLADTLGVEFKDQWQVLRQADAEIAALASQLRNDHPEAVTQEFTNLLDAYRKKHPVKGRVNPPVQALELHAESKVAAQTTRDAQAALGYDIHTLHDDALKLGIAAEDAKRLANKLDDQAWTRSVRESGGPSYQGPSQWFQLGNNPWPSASGLRRLQKLAADAGLQVKRVTDGAVHTRDLRHFVEIEASPQVARELLERAGVFEQMNATSKPAG